MKGMRIGYIRVSTEDQNTERQLQDIQVDKTFVDRASGKNLFRPQLEMMTEFIREGDTLVVWSMDRLARNLDDLRNLVQTFVKRGIHVQFIKENITFSGDNSPISLLTLSIMGAFAEFERSIILERQREGIALAKKKGLYKGRKKVLSKEEVDKLLERSKNMTNKAQIAREFNIGRSSVYNYLKVAS